MLPELAQAMGDLQRVAQSGNNEQELSPDVSSELSGFLTRIANLITTGNEESALKVLNAANEMLVGKNIDFKNLDVQLQNLELNLNNLIGTNS